MSIKKHKVEAIIIGIVALLIAACTMEVMEINFPDDAKVDTEITFTVKVQVITETDDKNTQFVFALLTPKSWDLKNNAKLTFTTDGLTAQNQSEIVDGEMIVIPDTETEKSTGYTYPLAYQSKIGLMGNTGSVEWTVFRSVATITIDDTVSTDPIYATVKITLTTGSESIRFFLGVGFCGTNWGLDTESGEGRYTANEVAKEVCVYDEDGSISLDYTVVQSVTTTPSAFRYGDIFSINYVATDTPLEGASQVYLQGCATLSDGTSVTIDATDDTTILYDNGSTDSWFRYIYPRQLFGFSQTDEISSIYIWFTDGTNEDKDEPDGKLLKQASE